MKATNVMGPWARMAARIAATRRGRPGAAVSAPRTEARWEGSPRPWTSLILDLEDSLDLDRHAVRQLLEAHRRAGVRPVVAPQVAEQVGRAVNDMRRAREVLGAVDHTQQLHDTPHLAEVAELCLHGGQ